jgi:hypothetical protein
VINFVLKIQENKVLIGIYRAVSSVVQLIPYYIMEEFYVDQGKINLLLEKEDSEIALLTRDDMVFLGNHEESNESTQEMIHWLDAGEICLALKYKGEIASYSWCDLGYLEYKGKRTPLRKNEAYLFNARTYQRFRGKNLAPYVRNELCRYLKTKGIDRFLSITLWRNTASMRFKQKSGAKPIELYLYVGLFRKYPMHFRLKKIAG